MATLTTSVLPLHVSNIKNQNLVIKYVQTRLESRRKYRVGVTQFLWQQQQILNCWWAIVTFVGRKYKVVLIKNILQKQCQVINVYLYVYYIRKCMFRYQQQQTTILRSIYYIYTVLLLSIFICNILYFIFTKPVYLVQKSKICNFSYLILLCHFYLLKVISGKYLRYNNRFQVVFFKTFDIIRDRNDCEGYEKSGFFYDSQASNL
eukprot:TRINITY_DN8533_c0_g1_i3.p2 TRINITY_DN8533_c0_g1~~TRINITY_DN8533_c0_g1_i3.p2  ORF type:complete len:205 (-),score=-13.78 TRINITY_DN8533_c0_g1_i3:53-667(-)